MEIYVITAIGYNNKTWYYYSGDYDSFSMNKSKIFNSYEESENALKNLGFHDKRNMSNFKIQKFKG
jgi:hypothetical protein